MNEKINLSVKIEVETLNNVEKTIKRKWENGPFSFKTPSELISDLLIKHEEKEFLFTDYLNIGQEKKQKSLNLTIRAKEAYDNIPDKNRTYVINGLLREWVKKESEEGRGFWRIK